MCRNLLLRAASSLTYQTEELPQIFAKQPDTGCVTVRTFYLPRCDGHSQRGLSRDELFVIEHEPLSIATYGSFVSRSAYHANDIVMPGGRIEGKHFSLVRTNRGRDHSQAV
jgi:hypothetical protein